MNAFFKICLLLASSFGTAQAGVGEDEDASFGVATAGATAAAMKPKLLRQVGTCSPGTKNEICRCMFFDQNAEKTRSFVIHAYPPKDPPKFCNDPRIQAVFSAEFGLYINTVYKVMVEQGLDDEVVWVPGP